MLAGKADPTLNSGEGKHSGETDEAIAAEAGAT
jgi:hypothetical protein